MAESRTNEYKMDDIQPSIFKLLMSFMYSNTIHLPWLSRDFTLEANEERHHEKCNELIKLSVLAERLLMPHICNHILGTLQTIFTRTQIVPDYALEYVYQNTFPESGLRTYIIVMGGKYYSPDFLDDGARIPNGLLLQITNDLTCGRFMAMNNLTHDKFIFKEYVEPLGSEP